MEADIKIFWIESEANGEMCKGCEQLIIGNKYSLMIQMGPTELLNINDIKGVYCKACKMEIEISD